MCMCVHACMQPIHAWRAYTDKLRGDSRHAGTSYAGVLPGSTADGLLANLVVLSHLRAIPNSDGNSLREFRTFGRSQVSVLGLWFINGLGRAIHHPECVHMSHGMLLYMLLHVTVTLYFFFLFFHRLPPGGQDLECRQRRVPSCPVQLSTPLRPPSHFHPSRAIAWARMGCVHATICPLLQILGQQLRDVGMVSY